MTASRSEALGIRHSQGTLTCRPKRHPLPVGTGRGGDNRRQGCLPVPRIDFLIAFRSFDMGGGFMLGFLVETC